jgi:hypothetical protein
MLRSLEVLSSAPPGVITRRSPEMEADRMALGATGARGPLHACAATIWVDSCASTPRPLQGTVEMGDAFELYRGGHEEAATHLLRSTSGSMYTPDMRLHEGFLLDFIEDALRTSDALIVYLDILGYSVDDHPGRPNESQAHATALFITRGREGGAAYHFNPHGRVARDDRLYEQYRTRTRIRTLELQESVDSWVVSRLIGCLNEQLSKRIVYGAGPRHNYFGPNLQAGDALGLCYAYPFLVHYAIASSPALDGVSSLKRGRGSRAMLGAAAEFLAPARAALHSALRARSAAGRKRWTDAAETALDDAPISSSRNILVTLLRCVRQPLFRLARDLGGETLKPG